MLFKVLCILYQKVFCLYFLLKRGGRTYLAWEWLGLNQLISGNSEIPNYTLTVENSEYNQLNHYAGTDTLFSREGRPLKKPTKNDKTNKKMKKKLYFLLLHVTVTLISCCNFRFISQTKKCIFKK